METIWFCLVAIMITLYVIFDGFDLGVGIIHLWVARTEDERRRLLSSIGPVWDGNEVWLLAAGGTLYFAFPALYASGFSGFYLPLMMVLWLLILRGIAIEFRNHIESPVWKPFWDVVFSGSSLLLTVFFGAALGNVVRGVPLDSAGTFFEPLWTDFRLGEKTGILDWFTILVGIVALLALTIHGAAWVAMKTDEAIQERSRRLVLQAWWALAAATIVLTLVTFRVQPQVPSRLLAQPWGAVFPALALAGLFAIRWFMAPRNEVKSFLASCAYIAGMLTSAVFGLYPYVLPASTDPTLSLTVHNAKAPDYGLKIGLVWWVPGMILVSIYFVFTYRHFAGKVQVDSQGHY
jgi:cytochrome d ubiquinol oxidase subunit II